MVMSIRAFARHKGVSDTAIHKSIARGEVQTDADGKIDSARNAAWQPRMQAGRTTTTDAPRTDEGAELAAKMPDYARARAIRETYAARLAKLEFEERSGKLVSADELQVVLFGHYRRLRDALLQIPAKIAPDIVALAAGGALTMRDVEDAIYTELHETLDEFANPPIA